MAKKPRDSRQMPMGFMLPESDWVAPTSLPDLSGEGLIAVDLETRDDGLAANRGPGWVYNAGWIAGIAVAWSTGSIYIPIRHPDTECMEEAAVLRWLQRLFRSGTRVVFHRAVYDLGWITHAAQEPLLIPEKLEDTMILEFMLNENEKVYGLDAVCARRGISGKDETLLRKAADALGCDPKSEMWKMPGRFVGPYASQDAVATRELFTLLLPILETQRCTEAYRLEVDLIPMIIAMRRRGVRVDTKKAPRVREQLLEKRDEYLTKLSDKLEIGRRIEITDVQSPAFLQKIFYDEGILDLCGKTDGGNPSFKTDLIEKIDHWLPDLVTGARKFQDAGQKFVGNYIEGFTHLGRIHSEIHQTKSDSGGTRTTRLAYSDPPLQQMPSRNEFIKKKIRGLFLPEKGQMWGALDYSQQEFRLMVHFAYLCSIYGVEEAVRLYRENPDTDFHDLAAELTKLPRRKAKDVNFAKAFGAGKIKFALMTGMTVEEAVETMDQYDEELPFIKGLSEYTSKLAKQRGYIRLIDGARSRYEKWEPTWIDWDKQRDFMQNTGWTDMPYFACSKEEAFARKNNPKHFWYNKKMQRTGTHKAMNSLIQGSAARQTKLCMRECWREGILPLLQMHDELDFSFDDPGVAGRAAEIMRDTVKLEIPVLVDSEFGVNWGRAAASEGYDASWESALAELRMAG